MKKKKTERAPVAQSGADERAASPHPEIAISVTALQDGEKKAAVLRNFKSVFLKEDAARHTEEYYEKICRHAIFLAAETAAGVCGYCAFYANDDRTKTAFITLIAVLPSMQGAGVGRALIAGACETAKRNGMTRIRLEVLQKNAGAIGF